MEGRGAGARTGCGRDSNPDDIAERDGILAAGLTLPGLLLGNRGPKPQSTGA